MGNVNEAFLREILILLETEIRSKKINTKMNQQLNFSTHESFDEKRKEGFN